MKVNIKLIILFYLVFSIGFSVTVHEGIVNIDGTIDLVNEGWLNADYITLYNGSGNDLGSVLFLKKSGFEDLCVALRAIDGTQSPYDYFQITFTNGPSSQINRGDPRTREYETYWTAEECFSFSSLGISKGDSTSLHVNVIHNDYRHSTADLSSNAIILQPVTEWGCLEYPTECCIDSDCGEGYYCDTQGSCTMIGNCVNDFDCNAGEQCGENWMCEPAPGACSSDGDCANNEYCAHTYDKCMPVSEGDCGYVDNHQWNEYECCDDSDCGNDEVCANNLCYVSCDSELNDCPGGYVCFLDACFEINEGNCYKDNDCKSYEVCNTDKLECELKQGACETDDNCEEGYTCNLDENSCKEIPEECEFECCSNSDCADDKYCSDNGCIAVPTGDCGYIDKHVWHDYSCCDDSDCSDTDEECVGHTCVEQVQNGNEGPVCSGSINLKFVYKISNNKIKALVSGINHCEGKIIAVREENCNGKIACFFKSDDEGGNCEFDVPDEEGFYLYSACADLDNDGTKEYDQEGYMVETSECTSVGCMPSEWSDCICEEGENFGIQTGTCTDNCEGELEYEQVCSCELGMPQEQIDANESIANATAAIDAAQEEGKDTADAEQKLTQAQEAYDAGNHELAKELADEAYAIATAEPIEKQWWEDINLWLIIGMVILGLVAIILALDKIFNKPEPPEMPVEPPTTP